MMTAVAVVVPLVSEATVATGPVADIAVVDSGRVGQLALILAGPCVAVDDDRPTTTATAALQGNEQDDCGEQGDDAQDALGKVHNLPFGDFDRCLCVYVCDDCHFVRRHCLTNLLPLYYICVISQGLGKKSGWKA